MSHSCRRYNLRFTARVYSAATILLSRAGVDAPVANVLLARFWSILSGPVSVVLIVAYLTPEEQGYYYTFASILGLKVLAEFGLSYVILQFAAHEMVDCEWTNGVLTGSKKRLSRLRDLFTRALRWYYSVAAFIVLVILPGGWLFFSITHESDLVNVCAWQAPWIALVAVNALAVTLVPAFAIIEGCGKVAEVTRNRMYEAMGMAAFLWIALVSGAGLYAPAISCLGGLLVSVAWLISSKRHFFATLLASNSSDRIDWFKEVFPLQWRTAISWTSGYLAYTMFIPFTFAYKGPDLAGQLGLTLKMTDIITVISGAWLQTKAAPFGRLAAERSWATLDRIYTAAFRRSLVAYGVCAFGFICLLYTLRFADATIAGRFLSSDTVVVLLAMWAMNHVLFARAIYLRSYKQECFYYIYLGAGISTVAATAVLLPRYGLLYTMMCVCICISLPSMILSGVVTKLARKKLQSA